MINFILIVIISVLVILLWRYYNRTEALVKKAKELEKSIALRDRLFSIIGHDLNNAIANIPASIEIFKQEITTAEEKTFILDSVEENTIAAVETLESLLNWGKSQMKGITVTSNLF